MAIEIVDLPIKSMVIFHSDVSLPEGTAQESVWTGVGPPVTFDAALLERRFALADARGKSAKNGANGHPIPGDILRLCGAPQVCLLV